MSRNRRCQRHSDLFQWFITTNVRNLSLVSSTHHVFNMNLSSFNIKSLIHSCLPAWGAHITKCMLSHSHLPAVITTLLNPPFDAQTDLSYLNSSLNHHPLIILKAEKTTIHFIASHDMHIRSDYLFSKMVYPGTAGIHQWKHTKISAVCIFQS